MAATLSLTRDHLARIGGWPVLKEAEGLVAAGRVEGVALDPATGTLTGRVKLPSGTGFFTPRLKPAFKLSEVEAVCSCRPAREGGIVCAHAVALGAAWLKPKAEAPAASIPAPAPQAKTEAPAETPSLFVPLDEAPPGSEPLFPSFLLPLQFAEAWRSGRMRVILEAAPEEGKPSQPWDAFIRNRKPPFAVPAAACAALRLLERRFRPLPGIVQLERGDFDAFFLSMTGEEAAPVSLGKKEPLALARSETLPVLHVTRLPDNAAKKDRLRIELLSPAEIGEVLPSPSGAGRWLLGGGKLTFLPGAGPALQSLAQGPAEIGIAELPHLLQLPSLAGKVEVRLDEAVAAIEWREGKPAFSVYLDGTPNLNAVVCRIEARYGGRSFPLLGRPLPKAGDASRWIADAATPGLFHGRNPAAEAAALADLAAAGFDAPPSAESAKLSGEREIIAFLADHLPEWRRHWEIETTPRMAALLEKCRPIETSIRVTPSGNDWLQVETTFSSRDGKVALSAGEVRQLLETGRTHKRLPSGEIALLPGRAVAEWQATLADCDPDSEASLGTARVASRYAPYLAETLREQPGVVWKAPAVPMRDGGGKAVPLPAALEAILRPYQKEGTAWLHRLVDGGFAGILADEMGLGKTLQTLAFLAARKEAGLSRAPSLVVAPTGLLTNWQREAARFAPGLRTAFLHGPDRHALLAKARDYDLLLTSYALLRRDGDAYAALALDTAILDEAQNIKNRSSQNAQAAKRLRAPHRLILTGTPLENSLLDLWSMFDFLMPGYLGPAKAFRDRYELPITKANDAPALKRLRRRVHPFLLRRTKAEVAKEIPDRIESIAWCELSDEQQAVYKALLDEGRREVFEHSGKQGSAAKRTMAMLAALTRLRQAACHLGLLPTDPAKAKEWEEPSAKLDTLFDLLEEAREGGHRLLVFSQFTKFLDLIEARLRAEGIAFCRLDGSTSPAARQAEIDRFQNGTGPEAVPLFLISLKAGGAGINLTAADTVVHCDPWWNPAAEDQATSRAHRIGQERVVTSYKLIARGTVEEKIVQLQEKKRDLIGKTLEGEEAMLSKLTQEEWEDLLTG
ncbi:MAG TPA: SNF2-related protein [Candidatus Methylacidiphilales bacterium]